MSRPTLVDKVKAMAALACIRDLSPSALRVGIRLLHHYNCQTGRCDPGVEYLSVATGLDQRSVFRAIRELERHELFSVRHRGGRKRTNFYRPNFARVAAAGRGETADPQNSCIDAPGTLTTRSTKPDNLGSKRLSGMSGEQVKEHLNEQGTESLHVQNPLVENSISRFAQQSNHPRHQGDPMTIDWAGWYRWLLSIRVPEPVMWVFNAIERIQTEANLNQDEAQWLLDKCLRKARATEARASSLDGLLTKAISKRRREN